MRRYQTKGTLYSGARDISTTDNKRLKLKYRAKRVKWFHTQHRQLDDGHRTGTASACTIKQCGATETKLLRAHMAAATHCATKQATSRPAILHTKNSVNKIKMEKKKQK